MGQTRVTITLRAVAAVADYLVAVAEELTVGVQEQLAAAAAAAVRA